MKELAGLVLSLCELAEAEGKVLRDNIQRTGRGCALIGLACFFLAVALCFLLAAIYDVLTLWLPKAGLLFVISLLATGIAAAFLGLAKKKRPKNIEEYDKKQR